MGDQRLGGGPQFKPISSSTTVKYLIGWAFPGSPVVKEGFAFEGRQHGFAGRQPGRGAKIPRASWPNDQNIKQKQYCNKFNEDFKNGSHNNNNKNLKKKKKLIRQPQKELSHIWRLGTLERQVRSLSSRGLQGRGGNTRGKAQWAQICEVTGKWEGQEVG